MKIKKYYGLKLKLITKFGHIQIDHGNGFDVSNRFSSNSIGILPKTGIFFYFLDPNDFPLSKFDPKRPGLWHRQMPGEPPKALQTSSKKKKKAA